jgi:hypothetical protein
MIELTWWHGLTCLDIKACLIHVEFILLYLHFCCVKLRLSYTSIVGIDPCHNSLQTLLHAVYPIASYGKLPMVNHGRWYRLILGIP